MTLLLDTLLGGLCCDCQTPYIFLRHQLSLSQGDAENAVGKNAHGCQGYFAQDAESCTDYHKN
jgi:hypothetical protein